MLIESIKRLCRSCQNKEALESSLDLAYISVNENNSLRTVEEIVEEINLLPPQERLRLIEQVTVRGQEEKITEEVGLAALDAFLAMAGKAEIDYSDVASDKYKHLADIYSDTHSYERNRPACCDRYSCSAF